MPMGMVFPMGTRRRRRTSEETFPPRKGREAKHDLGSSGYDWRREQGNIGLMDITSVRHIRWVPPEYQELVVSVACLGSSPEWVVYDLPYCPQRCLLWLPWSVVLIRHYGLGEPWYEPDLPWRADIVAISKEADGTLVVRDMFIDVSISEDGSRYKVIDIDEFMEVLKRGKISKDECIGTLQTLQRWLDMLHGFRVAKEFPPKSLPAAE